jgi:hypothetical protein
MPKKNTNNKPLSPIAGLMMTAAKQFSDEEALTKQLAVKLGWTITLEDEIVLRKPGEKNREYHYWYEVAEFLIAWEEGKINA